MAGENNIARMSPRQRMINLMYIVLTAMLALNVSSDVLNGFSQVHEGLDTTNANISARNDVQFRYLENLYKANPEKTGPWLEKGALVHKESQQLFAAIDSLKTMIAVQADGKDGDFNNLSNLDDLEAASAVMLDPISNRGQHLRERIDGFSVLAESFISDSVRSDAVARMLATGTSRAKGTLGPTTWEQRMFDNMPAVAAITILTKIQNDIRQAENEALSSIISNVDSGDLRVNELNAYVIPNSNMVMRGARYSANVVLAAVDTTSRPAVFVNGSKLANDRGLLEFTAQGSGPHDYSGYIEVTRADGSLARHPFSSSYTVIEPMATISATMMNVLYAGIDNPVSISVPGVPMNAVQASISEGSLTRNGNQWIARPGKVGSKAVITVTAEIDGSRQAVGQMEFRVRKLPDPSPYLPVKDAQGNITHYRGAPKRISKGALLEATSLGAAIDDDILNVSYSVVSFSTLFFDSMGNAIPEVSDGASFSARQKEQFRRLKQGKFFLITNVKAKGPDGITRDIPPMEVRLN